MHTIFHYNNETEIVVSIKTYTFIIMFLLIVSGICALFLVVTLVDLFVNKHFDYRLLGYLLFLIVGSLYLHWYIKGEESLVFTKNTMEVVRRNGKLTFRKKYDKRKITNVIAREIPRGETYLERETRMIGEKRRVFPFWSDMGRIEFKYENKYYSVLNGLEDSELIEILEVIKQELAK